MITAGDIKLWALEGEAALKGGHVHRVWRTDDTWVLLVRHHEQGDPERRAVRRVALEVALPARSARCVAVTPEWVQADDKKLKKTWARDAHPHLAQLRKQLAGCRVRGLEQLGDDRILRLWCERPTSSPDNPEAQEGPRYRALAVELIGRTGNLILLARADEDAEWIVTRALNSGRKGRPFEPGESYQLPPPRPGGSQSAPALTPDIEPDAEALAVGLAAARLQRAVADEQAQSSRVGGLRRAARRAIKRSEGVLKKLEAQLAEVAKADDYERRADLIKANLGRLPKQASKITVTDYTGEEPVEVELELDPRKTVQDAMKALYKKAKKLRKGEVHVHTRMGETDAVLEELRAVLGRIDEADDDDDDDDETTGAIERELRRLKALPKTAKTAAGRQKQQVNQGPRSFRSAEGHEILVGRSDDENDKLTMRVARARDLFFHVRGCPGSHVILRVDPSRPPNHESLMDAACLAAYYSKARQRGQVDVGYTPRKWVKKPKGAKPGLVQVSNSKTLRVSGAGERIKRVLNSLRRPEDKE